MQLSVIGVHGESQVVAWSNATIDGMPVDKFLPPEPFVHSVLANECKARLEKIIQAKGATPFGIGSVVASICSAILYDRAEVVPLSHFQPDFGCCFSLPVIVGRKGIVKTIEMPLSSEEKAELSKSAKKLVDMVERIKKNQ